MDIEGNDRADEMAKEVTNLEPTIENTTLAKLHWQLWESLKTEWIGKWANKPITGQYAIANHHWQDHMCFAHLTDIHWEW